MASSNSNADTTRSTPPVTSLADTRQRAASTLRDPTVAERYWVSRIVGTSAAPSSTSEQKICWFASIWPTPYWTEMSIFVLSSPRGVQINLRDESAGGDGLIGSTVNPWAVMTSMVPLVKPPGAPGTVMVTLSPGWNGKWSDSSST